MSTDSLLGPPATLAHLLTELQSKGLRVEASMEARHGGAGPSDSGMLWIEGVAVTCLLYTSPSPRDKRQSRMPSSA